MRVQKILAIGLSILFLLSLAAGCKPAAPATTTVPTQQTTKGTTGSTTKPAGTQATTPGSTAAATTKPQAEPGTELTEFMERYMDAKEPIWEMLSSKMTESQDMNLIMGLMGFAAADLYVAIIPMFDSVEQAGGILMISGVKNAFKKVDGHLITFGYDYKYEQDSGNYKKDDQVTCKGKYDTQAKSLTVEMIDQVDAKLSSRTVTEVNQTGDGAYIAQFIIYSASDSKVTGYFSQFAGGDIWSAFGTKDGGDNFTFNSIFGKSSAKLADMTPGFSELHQASMVGGEFKSVN